MDDSLKLDQVNIVVRDMDAMAASGLKRPLRTDSGNAGFSRDSAVSSGGPSA